MKRLTLLLLLLAAALASAQNTATIGVLPDSGAALPATCNMPQIYFKTTATVGLYACTSPNTWVQLAGGGSGTVSSCGAAGLAYYSASGTTITCDTNITDSGAGALVGPAGSTTNVTYATRAANNGVYSAAVGDVSISAGGARTLAVQANANYLGGVVNNLSTLHMLVSMSAPTIAAAGCGGSAASIPAQNGTAAFSVNVGTTNTGTCTITMPSTASNGWACSATDVTTNSTTVFVTKQAVGTTGTVVLKNYSDVATNVAWTDSDVLNVHCTAF